MAVKGRAHVASACLPSRKACACMRDKSVVKSNGACAAPERRVCTRPVSLPAFNRQNDRGWLRSHLGLPVREVMCAGRASGYAS